MAERIDELESRIKNVEERFEKLLEILDEHFNENKTSCPKCGSTDVHLGARGTSIKSTLFLGSLAHLGSTDLWYTCLNCKKRWAKYS